MFVEKYRPDDFKNVVGLNQAIIKLMNNDMPHFMFIGPAGTGKTTTAKIIINFLGCNVLKLNGSDERGIDTIRNKVKEFAMTLSTDGHFKIVFLDEMDALTKDAQAILRNLMETYAENCRFIMTANYSNKILDPIKSRCQIYEFKNPSKNDVLNRLQEISKLENINISELILKKLILKYYPDIRSMINKLEELSKHENITEDLININDAKIKELYNLLVQKNYSDARIWCLNSCEEFSFILNSLFKYVVRLDILKVIKISIIEAIGETEFRLGLSVDKEVQISAGLVRIMKAME